jgi:hypothetical protein
MAEPGQGGNEAIEVIDYMRDGVVKASESVGEMAAEAYLQVMDMDPAKVDYLVQTGVELAQFYGPTVAKAAVGVLAVKYLGPSVLRGGFQLLRDSRDNRARLKGQVYQTDSQERQTLLHERQNLASSLAREVGRQEGRSPEDIANIVDRTLPLPVVEPTVRQRAVSTVTDYARKLLGGTERPYGEQVAQVSGREREDTLAKVAALDTEAQADVLRTPLDSTSIERRGQ